MHNKRTNSKRSTKRSTLSMPIGVKTSARYVKNVVSTGAKKVTSVGKEYLPRVANSLERFGSTVVTGAKKASPYIKSGLYTVENAVEDGVHKVAPVVKSSAKITMNKVSDGVDYALTTSRRAMKSVRKSRNTRNKKTRRA